MNSIGQKVLSQFSELSFLILPDDGKVKRVELQVLLGARHYYHWHDAVIRGLENQIAGAQKSLMHHLN